MTISIVLFVLPLCRCVAQQKMQFTQYMFNGIVINPAYAGADEVMSLTFIQRNQWMNIEDAPSTQTFSAHTLFRKKHFGLGMTFINDKLGVHKNSSILTHYAYHLKTGKASYFSMGLQAGLFKLKSDYTSLLVTVPQDPRISSPVVSETFVDFGAGIYYRSPRFHAGVSAPELLPQQVRINDSVAVHLSKVNLFVFSRYTFHINEFIDLQPSGLLKYLDGVPVSYDVNMNLVYRNVLVTGLSYRKAESVDFLLKAQVNEQLQLGYSYDHPIGIIARVGNGSHELMINYVFRYIRKNRASPRT